MARGYKLRHNEIYESGGCSSFRYMDDEEDEGVIKIKKKR